MAICEDSEEYFFFQKVNGEWGGVPIGITGVSRFQDSREKGAYSCIQEKNLHMQSDRGNSGRIARDRPAKLGVSI